MLDNLVQQTWWKNFKKNTSDNHSLGICYLIQLLILLFSLFKKYRDLSAGGIRGFQWMGVSHLAIKDVNALM